jgi:methylthioribose-1-phosphate isomerase
VNTDHLESLISASVDWIDSRINGFVTPTNLEFNSYDYKGDKIILEHRNFNEITTFKVNDIDYTDYRLINKFNSTYIYLLTPITTDSTVTITYSAGSDTPNNFIQAVLITAADMYDTDRSNYSTGLTNNRTVMRLLNLE